MGLDMFIQDEEENERAYWRKANQILTWFEDNISDFDVDEEMLLNKETLEELVKTCNEVLKYPDKAEELLPDLSPYASYDEFYFLDLESTVRQLTPLIETFDWENEKLYLWISY